ncbi:MAG TPA: nuclear transport factor 2 family protein, partial [Archangium sp.]|nr:nuclear transport factor 2 family protein [Archangium sp.]
SLAATVLLGGCATTHQEPKENPMSADKKQQVVALLKSLETGDRAAASVIDPNHYVQHNLAAGDGIAGLAALLEHAPPGSIKVDTVRVFQDGDEVFAHSQYEFFGPKVGFDIFRFENGLIVEHWDNLQERPARPNPSGRTMLDGPTQPGSPGVTASNKALVREFVETILVAGKMDRLGSFFEGDHYLQHNPQVADGLSGLGAALQAMAARGMTMKYDRVHKVLGEGDFVLTVSEGTLGDRPTSFYDLFRVDNGRIAEHWDTIEAIPPRADWKNGNGKF